MSDAAFEIPPAGRLAAVIAQRNRALDESAAWEAVAFGEKEKVRVLENELMRQAALLDELQRDAEPGSEKSDSGTVDYLPIESSAAERA